MAIDGCGVPFAGLNVLSNAFFGDVLVAARAVIGLSFGFKHIRSRDTIITKKYQGSSIQSHTSTRIVKMGKVRKMMKMYV